MVLRIGTEWCQHHGGVSCSFLLTLLTYCAISWASVTRNKKKYLCATYTRTPEQYIHLCTWNWWIGPQRSLWNEGSGGRSSSGPPQPSGRSEGWNRWVGVDQLLVLQLERPIVFFFCGENGSDWGREGKGKKADKDLKESISWCLPWDSGKRTTHKPLRPPNSRIPLPGHDTPQTPSAKHTSPPLCCHSFPLFFLFSLYQFLCFVCFVLNAQVPKLSNQSAPGRETKDLVL